MYLRAQDVHVPSAFATALELSYQIFDISLLQIIFILQIFCSRDVLIAGPW